MRSLKKALLIMLAAAMMLTAFSGCGQTEVSGKGLLANASLPSGSIDLDFSSFVAPDINGKAVSADIFKDHKLTMLNIWATFCGPCLREMPDIQTLSEEYADDLQVIGVVLDIIDGNLNTIPDIKQEALKIIEQTGVGYRQLIPSKSLVDLLLSDIQFVPTTVFIDENGRSVGELYVGSRTKAEWESIVKMLLEEVK